MDETPIVKAEMYIARLGLGFDATVSFVNTDSDGGGYNIVHTLDQTDDWDITAINNLYINVDFQRFRVIEFDGFEDILDESEFVYYEQILYKMERTHRPIGLTRVWEFKLEPVSIFPIEIPLD